LLEVFLAFAVWLDLASAVQSSKNDPNIVIVA